MKLYTIKNHICNIPVGMELNRRSYYMTAPIGLDAKVFREYKKPDERFSVTRIVSLIKIYQQQFEDGKNMFVNISRDTLVQTAGKGYRNYLNWLIEMKIVEENEKYSNVEGNAFSKSFRFTDKAFSKDVSVTKWEISESVTNQETYNSKVSATTFTPDGRYDAELLYCLSQENRLSIEDADKIIESMPLEEMSYASEWFYKINLGQCLPNPQTRSSRFYLNSIMMKSAYRKHLSYNKNEKLINFDVKCCHPAFIEALAGLAVNNNKDKVGNNKDKVGNTTYVFHLLRGNVFIKQGILDDFYKNDFYDLLAKETGKTREETKKEYNRYKNSSMEVIKNHPFTMWYKNNKKGSIADFIIESVDLWKTLEDLETELLCSICNRCIDEGLVFIRQHDGFLTISKDINGIESILSELPHNIFQYKME